MRGIWKSLSTKPSFLPAQVPPCRARLGSSSGNDSNAPPPVATPDIAEIGISNAF